MQIIRRKMEKEEDEENYKGHQRELKEGLQRQQQREKNKEQDEAKTK